jgi:hypothetical protein
MTRAAKLLTISRGALDRQAQELLDPDTVLTLATKAASAGAVKLRLTLDVAGDLRGTAAAKALEAILTREGFKLSWESRLVSGKANVTGVDLSVFEPVIAWDVD